MDGEKVKFIIEIEVKWNRLSRWLEERENVYISEEVCMVACGIEIETSI